MFFILGQAIIFAQTKEVSGIVTDDTGPLPGVNVIIKGSTTGTDTDFDGHYSIVVNQGDVLVYSYVGMESKEITVGDTSIINVMLVSENVLDEVVIVGYGTTTKKSYTGTVKTVKSEDLEIKSHVNVSQSLVGESAGVNIINTSGQPGTVATVRIRGFGSVNGNRDPLYVVDGVPFSGNINSINPADIASTSILKDATATAIYGARGANGVILINTKTGKTGNSSIEVDIKTGFNADLIPRNEMIRSPEEYIELSWESLYNRGVATNESNPEAYANYSLFTGEGISSFYNMWNVKDGSDLIDPATGKVRSGVTRKYDPENWEDYGFRTSFRTEGNVRFSGGDEKSKYFTSIGYLNDEGYIIKSDYTRYSTRLNLSHDVKEWLTGTVNLGYAFSKSNNNGQSEDSKSIFWFVDNMPSIYPLFLRDEQGNMIPEPIFGGNQYDYGENGRGFGALTNSIADAYYDGRYHKRHELNGSFGFDVKLFDFLSFETKLGAQYYNNKYNSLVNPFYGSSAQIGGSIFKYDTELFSKNFIQLLRFKNDYELHGIEVIAAHETNDWERKRNTASKSKAVVPDIDDLNNFIVVSSPPTSYTDMVKLESYFGQVNYNYDGKYFFTGSIRNDGSSRFAKDKWGTFGSVGVSWVLSREKFLENNNLIDYLKLKASYGLIGEQAGIGFYPGYNTFSIDNLNDDYSISPDDNGNPDLTWETSKMFQTGIEFNLGTFLEANIDYYVKNTDNLIFDRRVGPSQGIALIRVNDGQLRNSGLEFDLTTHIIDRQKYKLDFTFNGELLKNEITTMPIEPATGENKIIDASEVPYGWAKGHSVYDFYVREWAGVDPSTGVGMWYMYYHDANANGIPENDEIVKSVYDYRIENPDNELTKTLTTKYADAGRDFIGKSAVPKIRGAFRLGAKIHDFDFSTQFTYSLGGYVYDFAYAGMIGNHEVGNNNWHIDVRDRWQKPGDITNIPRISDGFDTNVSSVSSRFIKRSDYLGLNNVMIGYNIPEKYTEGMGLQNLNVWLSGDNLMLLTGRKGFNPLTHEAGETSQYTYSPLSTFTMGVRIKF